MATSHTLALEPWLLAVGAALLLLLDALLALWLRGYLQRSAARRRGRGGGLLLMLAAAHARADDAINMKAALDTRLAYVMTGLADVDAISKAGLTGPGPGAEGAHLL